MIPILLFTFAIAIMLGAVWCVKNTPPSDQSVWFNGFQIIKKDGSFNQSVAPEIVQAYLKNSR